MASDKNCVIALFIPWYVKVFFSPQWLKTYTFNKRKIQGSSECSMAVPTVADHLLYTDHWEAFSAFSFPDPNF